MTDNERWTNFHPEAMLPEGKTCADCTHVQLCTGLGMTRPENPACDFIPIRFRELEKEAS